MSTYKEVQLMVKEHEGFTPKTCWIAHVLSDHGKVKQPSINRIDQNTRKYPCPKEKRDILEKYLKQLNMI